MGGYEELLLNPRGGAVGIGITAPAATLHVFNTAGTVPFLVNNSTGTAGTGGGIRILAPISNAKFNWMIAAQQSVDNAFEITPSTAANGTTFSNPAFLIGSDGSVVINESGLSTGDVRIEGDTDANLFFVDASADFVGIGTAGPSSKFHVETPGSGAGVTFRKTGATNNPGLFISTTEATNIVQLDVTGSTGGHIFALATDSTERMRLDANEINFKNGQKVKRTASAITYTALVTDYYIGITSTAAARTVNLPAAATAGAGKVYIIKDESYNASVNNITVDPSGAELIDNAATKVINTNGGSITIICDGAAWHVV